MNVSTKHTISLKGSGGILTITSAEGRDLVLSIQETGANAQEVTIGIKKFDWDLFAKEVKQLLGDHADDPRG